MACFHPITAYDCGINPETGKKIISFTPSRAWSFEEESRRTLQLPCGKCTGCQIDRSRQWANRCMMELEYHERACFVTLTYDEVHIPRSYYGEPSTGVALPSLTLSKRDVQLFFKRLRKAHPEAHIRYFGCGEYGPNTFRPHYHIILFGIDFPDIKPLWDSHTGNGMFTSEQLNKAWSFPPRDLKGESYFCYSQCFQWFAAIYDPPDSNFRRRNFP